MFLFEIHRTYRFSSNVATTVRSFSTTTGMDTGFALHATPSTRNSRGYVFNEVPRLIGDRKIWGFGHDDIR
jgi:hypothetical protein